MLDCIAEKKRYFRGPFKGRTLWKVHDDPCFASRRNVALQSCFETLTGPFETFLTNEFQ